MAHLSERGQMILIAAFALAVTFVALALVVNSAIFTENLASRGETSGAENALLLRHEVETGAGRALGYANVHNVSTHTSARDAFRDGLRNTTRTTERQQATAGAFVNVTYVSKEDGSRIAQNDSSLPEFRSASGNANWDVVDDVTTVSSENGTRAFEMNVTKSSLAGESGSHFTVVVEKWKTSSETYEVEVYHEDGNQDNIFVEVAHPDVGGTERCTKSTDTAQTSVRIHLTRGLLDGEPCDALRHQVDLSGSPPTAQNYRFAAGVDGHYNISFENGGDAAGNYSLVTTNASIGSSNTLNTGGSRTSPYATDALYATTIQYRYDSRKLHYETDVRVAPEENP